MPGTKLLSNFEVPAKIEIFRFATKAIPRQNNNESIWKIAGHMDFSIKNIFEGKDTKLSAKNLTDILKVYAPRGDNNFEKDLDGIVDLYYKTSVERTSFEGAIDFVEGIAVFMVVNPDLFLETNLYLFCDVINEILSMLVSVNSFCKLNVATTDNPENWVTWDRGTYGKAII